MARAKAQINMNAMLILMSRPLIGNALKGVDLRQQLSKCIVAVDGKAFAKFLIEGLLDEAKEVLSLVNMWLYLVVFA